MLKRRFKITWTIGLNYINLYGDDTRSRLPKHKVVKIEEICNSHYKVVTLTGVFE